MIYSLEGVWQADIGDGQRYMINLPGTLDENRIGSKDTGSNQWHPDQDTGLTFQEGAPICTRFTRNYTYEGVAKLTRRVAFALEKGKRIFLEVERARCLRCLVDGQEISGFVSPSISTPHIFELTDCWKGNHEITLLSDNHYSGLPREAIVYSSAATDETQTNWNGVLGYVRLRVEEPVFVEAIHAYPIGNDLTVKVCLNANMSWKGVVSVSSKALQQPVSTKVAIQEGKTEIVLDKLPFVEDVVRWDENEGALYELTVRLEDIESSKTILFGVRDFAVDATGRLSINGRTIFLRSEANCAVFPETGYCPMSEEAWREILTVYQSYGINCVRFHSHCPPEAAFVAADQMGMLMQPELSHWNPKDAFESEESFAYYQTELSAILAMLANHPSFVMLTFGNELHASKKGHDRMKTLLDLAHQLDATRLYANGSNVHYGALGCDEKSDFYTSFYYYDQPLRGTYDGMKGYINHEYPSASTNYDKTMTQLRKQYTKPVFSFEVGQFEVLPDFDELETFHGITNPINFYEIKKRVEKRGLLPVWKQYVEATGEIAKIGYREEIEAAMRTKQMSGISLLGLQDFPGQGTALVGMLNAHLQTKPYPFAQPSAFRAFFTSQLPLVLLPKYTYENTENLEAKVQIANYGKEEIRGVFGYRLEGADFCVEHQEGERVCPVGSLTEIGTLCISLAAVVKPVRLELTVFVGLVSNHYPIWVYPPIIPTCPETLYETVCLDDQARAVLEAGKTVYLSPPSTKEALPLSVQAQFTTDFWSVGTFPSQEGTMGQLIDANHPIFKTFPTEFHTNWQWWPMASQRAVLLPESYKAIVTEMDSYAYLRPMAQLLECRCGNGKLVFSTMGLQDLQCYPEARALLASIYTYMDSQEFVPQQEISWDVLKTLVQ